MSSNILTLTQLIEAAAEKCFIKQVFSKSTQNSQEKTCAGVSFNRVPGVQFHCFPVNFANF